MRDLKDLGLLLVGFMPWLLFLFISGHSLASLERAILICLLASLTFGFGELRRGYILQWGTLVFFAACALLVNALSVTWVAMQMDLLANLTLACIIWLTILVGKPFALQYARRDLPKEQWNDKKLIEGCRFISIIWAILMSLAVGVSVIRRTSVVQAPSWVFFTISICLILAGVTFTTIFKRQKRLQREKGASAR
jgi:carotenoid cleavage dioxygenase